MLFIWKGRGPAPARVVHLYPKWLTQEHRRCNWTTLGGCWGCAFFSRIRTGALSKDGLFKFYLGSPLRSPLPWCTEWSASGILRSVMNPCMIHMLYSWMNVDVAIPRMFVSSFPLLTERALCRLCSPWCIKMHAYIYVPVPGPRTPPPPPNGMVPPLPRIIRILGMMLAMLGMLSSMQPLLNPNPKPKSTQNPNPPETHRKPTLNQP